ncbi:MAG: hypothetical protein KDB22_17785 [Planctomycetales bacterium]|nr:hypothetical protein [Planctomycetales bacterium]
MELWPVVSREYDVWKPPRPRELLGTITDFDAQTLFFTQSDGKVLQLPSDRVSRISVSFNGEVAEASNLVAEHRYLEAITKIKDCYQSVPQWQQQILVAQIVQSLAAIEDTRRAAIIFGNLTDAEPRPLLFYECIPLCWTVQETDAALLSEATNWLQSENESMRLIAASWLLLGERKAQAQTTLTSLKQSQVQVIAMLAGLQAWRLTPVTETKDRLVNWLAYRDSLPPPLQLGPTEFIADRLMRAGENDLAIGQWMRIAAQSSTQHHRVAQALESAANQLARSGHSATAQNLLPWIAQLREKQ